jgi:hypothetical protein
VPQCTFDAMMSERWRYTPQSVAWKTDPTTGRPYDSFVRRGQVGEGAEFADTVLTPELKAQWMKDMEIAKRHWQNAGVNAKVVDRYLKAD